MIYYGKTGKLENTTTQQYVSETGEWNTITIERWIVSKEEEAGLIASFKSGRNGYMMEGQPQIEKKGWYREITATFGPTKGPETLEWYTSTSKGLVVNRREIVPLEQTAELAAAAASYYQGLPGNGMQCTPQNGNGMVACTSSWGPPEDGEDAIDEKEAKVGEEVNDGATVSGAEAGVTPTVPLAMYKAGIRTFGDWQKKAALCQEIIAGSINQFPSDYEVYANQWHRGKIYYPCDSEIIVDLSPAQPWAQAAHEISQIRSLPYSSQRITINTRIIKEDKMETLPEILARMKNAGKLYKTVEIRDVKLEQPIVTSAMIKAYGEGSVFDGAAPVIQHVWKFDGVSAETIGKGVWIKEKQPDGKTKKTRKYLYKIQHSFSSMIVMYLKTVDPEIEILDSYSV